MYLVNETELDKLKNGELEIEDLAKPDRVVLITWSGEDVRLLLEKRFGEGTCKKIDFGFAVRLAEKALGYCDCAMCVEAAIDYVSDELKLKGSNK